MDTKHQLTDADASMNFMLAGNARVTLVSQRTGARFTFKVRAKEGSSGPLHFVSVLSGPDNGADYAYLGTLFGERTYAHGRKSRISSGAPSAQAFAYAWGHLVAGRMPPNCEVWHEGRCGKCNRALTVPESIATGLGPVCAAAA